MFGLLNFIFIVILVIGVLVLSVIAKVAAGIFRTGKRMTEKMSSSYNEEEARKESTSSPSSPHKKKVFDSDEGEYIDFEEIKE